MSLIGGPVSSTVVVVSAAADVAAPVVAEPAPVVAAPPVVLAELPESSPHAAATNVSVRAKASAVLNAGRPPCRIIWRMLGTVHTKSSEGYCRLRWQPTIFAFTSALDQAAMLRNRDVSPVELAELYLDRIERINPRLGAYITVSGEHALDAARAAEKALTSGEDVPDFCGVPISIKDLNDTAGIRSRMAPRVGRPHPRAR